MDVTGFVDFDLQDPEAVTEFIDLNNITHEAIYEALLRNGIVVERYPLWTDGGFNPDWLAINFKELQAWSTSLNIGLPPDMDSVNTKDDQQMLYWLDSNVLFLQQVASALGL